MNKLKKFLYKFTEYDKFKEYPNSKKFDFLFWDFQTILLFLYFLIIVLFFNILPVSAQEPTYIDIPANTEFVMYSNGSASYSVILPSAARGVIFKNLNNGGSLQISVYIATDYTMLWDGTYSASINGYNRTFTPHSYGSGRYFDYIFGLYTWPSNFSSSWPVIEIPNTESEIYINAYSYLYGENASGGSDYPESINWTRPYTITERISDLWIQNSKMNAQDQKYIMTNINLYDPSDGVMESYWITWIQHWFLNNPFTYTLDEANNKLSITWLSSNPAVGSVYYSSINDYSFPYTVDTSILWENRTIDFNIIEYNYTDENNSPKTDYYYVSEVIENNNGTYMKLFIYGFDLHSKSFFGSIGDNTAEIQPPYTNTWSSYSGWYYVTEKMRLNYPGEDFDNSMIQYGEPGKYIDSEGDTQDAPAWSADDLYFKNNLDSVDSLDLVGTFDAFSQNFNNLIGLFTSEADELDDVISLANQGLNDITNYSVSFTDSNLLNAADFISTELDWVYNNTFIRVPVDIALYTALILGVLF